MDDFLDESFFSPAVESPTLDNETDVSSLFVSLGDVLRSGGSERVVTTTADVLRSGPVETTVFEPSSKIYDVPPVIAEREEGTGFDFGKLFRSVVTPAASLAGTALAGTVTGSITGRPASSSTPPGTYRPPSRPFVLPSFLGGGVMASGATFSPLALMALIVGGILLFVFVRR